jgi:6-phosphogluconolactonase (cycloisomerase 2 family)
MDFARWTALSMGLWTATAATAHAQPAAVWAGANDNPNTLITGIFDGSTMAYLPEVPAGGSGGGGGGFVESQVRAFAGAALGRCSLVAQTNTLSSSVAIYTIDVTGAATHVAGSPFPTGGVGSALAWSRDGQALYVSRAIVTPASVETFRVACTLGGPATVTDAGPTTLNLFTGLRDLDVTVNDSHLCVTGAMSNNAGCFPIDPVTRLPGSNPVNTIPVPNSRGLRISGATGCGVLGLPTLNQVSAFFVTGAGVLTPTNTAACVVPPFYGAVSPDGLFAAFGGTTGNRRVCLYNLTQATCQLAFAGSTADADAGGAPYVAFDRANRLYVADENANRIRVFQATSGGPGAAISTSTTNHGTLKPPIGIDAALLSDLPIALQSFSVE